MKLLTYILFFSFLLSIVGKANILAFIKKIKSPIELASANEIDDEARGIDDDENKEGSEKEESEEKNPCFLASDSHYAIATFYNCNKLKINFYKLLFKSHFKEVATPPPELV